MAEPPPVRAENTGDLHDPTLLAQDVSILMDVIGSEGGVAIAPLDVAYAIVAQTRTGIETLFRAKNRSFDKPSGFFANADMSDEIHVLPSEKRHMIRVLINEVCRPFSVVAPFDGRHKLFSHLDPWVLQTSSKLGTLDMLLNAGTFHDEIARQALERGRPVFGSSANTSLQGSKYRYADIEGPVRDAATIAFDYGLSKYANPQGRSSTIIDFANFEVIRIGVVFDEIARAFDQRFGIDLKITDATAGKGSPS